MSRTHMGTRVWKSHCLFFWANARLPVHPLTSVHKVGPVDDSEALEDAIQRLLGQCGPGNGYAFRWCCYGLDVFRGVAGHWNEIIRVCNNAGWVYQQSNTESAILVSCINGKAKENNCSPFPELRNTECYTPCTSIMGNSVEYHVFTHMS